MRFIELSFDELRARSQCLAAMVRSDGFEPDCVAYLARGGWPIGEEIAHCLNVPLIELSSHRSGEIAKESSSVVLSHLPRFARHLLRETEQKIRLSRANVSVDRKVSITNRYPAPKSASQLLFVDDALDTGLSANSAVTTLRNLFPEAEVRIASLSVSSRSLVTSDWYLYKDILLCTPASKDSGLYMTFNKLYKENASMKELKSPSGTDGGNHPLISVIVPFFNIEDCVEYCVNSLLAQTYDNYELILVDDGSTDSTGKKLDIYNTIENVTVCHKENGGLSDARNIGVKLAKGEFVSFVDGDDLVSPNYLEVLVGGLCNGMKTLVSAQPKTVLFKEAETFRWGIPSAGVSYQELTPKQALENVLYEEIKTSAWAKLAPKEIYENNKFPTGRYYEEISTVGTYITNVDLVVTTDAEIYGYVMRPNSIVHRKKASIKQVYDYFKALDCITDLCQSAEMDSGALKFHRCLQLSRIHTLLRAVEPITPENKKMDSNVISSIKLDIPNVLNNPKVSFKNKIRFCLLTLLPRCYDLMYSIFDRVKRGIS